MYEMKLRPKNIIICGGASGIGFAAARKLLDSGASSIILASRNYDKLEKAKIELNDKRVFICKFDIADCGSHQSFIDSVDKLLGESADGLVISSGANFDGSNWKGFNIGEHEYDKVMNTNLKGPFFLMRTFANHLHAKSVLGNICIVSSISAHRDLMSVYQISKNAISGIVHSYGKYLCERGIVLNCVEPGTTEGGMLGSLEKYTNGIRGGRAME